MAQHASPSNPLLIAFVGPIGSGKSTAATYLVQEHGAKQLHFAGALKKMCGEYFGLSHEQLHGTPEQKARPDGRWEGKSPREILQFVGTELFRKRLGEFMPNLGDNFWVQNLMLQYTHLVAEPASGEGGSRLLVVIDDCRFPNEAQAVKDKGGLIVRIQREDLDAGAHQGIEGHESETAGSGIKPDVVICNSGTDLAAFHEEIKTKVLQRGS